MRLDDFFHLPALADAFAALRRSPPSLTLIAGFDMARPSEKLLPSGRTTIFRIVADALLEETAGRAAIIGVDSGHMRVPRGMRGRVVSLPVQRRHTYAARIAEALATNARLLILDTLPPECAPLLASAMREGVGILTTLNSHVRGVSLLGELGALGLAEPDLPAHVWCVAVRRLAMLCPSCRETRPLSPLQRLQLDLRSRAGLNTDGPYYAAPGCANCNNTGRSGTVSVFDISRFRRVDDTQLECERILPLESYAQDLALRGDLAFDDVADPDGALTGRLVQQFAAQERELATTQQTLDRKLAELRVANDVLQQRTTALVSLQAIGQALVSSNELRILARRICQHVCELCGADRAVLYLLEADGTARILAVSGWSATYLGTRVDGAAIRTTTSEPSPHEGWPPGIPEQHADVLGGDLRAGLCVPLIAESEQVGMLIIHSMSRRRFEPGETALLQTFGHQAALSIQRTRLIEQLHDNLVQLQAAQAALVQQERLAREMELAAEVQQSILPHVFPDLPGLSFAADNLPARQVGGDFYDVFMLDDTTIGIVIADVSGKGIPAALYMALTRSLLLAEARRERSPRAALLNVNRVLREVGDPHMFVTVFYGLLETASQELTFARAGHDYPLLFRDGQAQQLTGTGTVLGMLDNQMLQLSEEHVTLQGGDRLVLYTDGLTDVVNPDDQRFELPQLQALLLEQHHGTPDEICQATFAALRAYRDSAEQYDDMTLLVVGVEPAES